MYKNKKIAVVVPAYKEELLIAATIDGVPDFVDLIIVVDDASPDSTSEAATATKNEKLHLVRLEQNQGVGGAVLTGHKIALEFGMDISVVVPGDNQADPKDLSRLIDPICEGTHKFSKGNRFNSRESIRGMPFMRLVGNVFFTFLNKAASGYWHLFDPQCGYTAISTDVLSKLPLEKIRKRYDFENDLLIWLSIFDVPACDVSIEARYANETSTISMITTVPRIFRTLFLGFWRRIFYKYVLLSFSPIALLLFSGIFLEILAVLFGAFAIKYSIGPGSASTGTVLLAVTPAMTGIYLLINAMVMDIEASPGWK
jgi:glycosyltransferase involved in cell wall biosynthesis